MADGDGLEQRVATLEAQVRELTDRVGRSEHDATAARVLAGGADRDVGEIRAEIRDFREQNNRVLNTMREDLTDLRGDFTDLRSQVIDLSNRVDTGFAQVRGALDAAAAGQSRIVELLDRALGPRPLNGRTHDAERAGVVAKDPGRQGTGFPVGPPLPGTPMTTASLGVVAAQQGARARRRPFSPAPRGARHTRPTVPPLHRAPKGGPRSSPHLVPSGAESGDRHRPATGSPVDTLGPQSGRPRPPRLDAVR